MRELEQLLTLEEAVRKITSLPADVHGLSDRGRIELGKVADLVAFDPQTIRDRSTWVEPQLYSEGVEHLFVSGVAVLRDGELTGATPGRFVSRGNRLLTRHCHGTRRPLTKWLDWMPPTRACPPGRSTLR